jgi:hypothetical protein
VQSLVEPPAGGQQLENKQSGRQHPGQNPGSNQMVDFASSLFGQAQSADPADPFSMGVSTHCPLMWRLAFRPGRPVISYPRHSRDPRFNFQKLRIKA